MSLTFNATIVRPRLRCLISWNASSSVGIRTFAKEGWNHEPASNFFNSADVNSRTERFGPSVVRSKVSSCRTTSLPSLVVRMSNSKPMPNSKQVANAGSVFSGVCLSKPRCATRIGSAKLVLSFRPAFDFGLLVGRDLFKEFFGELAAKASVVPSTARHSTTKHVIPNIVKHVSLIAFILGPAKRLVSIGH